MFMNIKKISILALALLVSAIPAGRMSFEMAKAEENENRIWLSTEENVIVGDSVYACTKINMHEEISALSIEIHFNSDVLSVYDTYNSISTTIYDYSINEDSLTYTYIFDEVGLNYEQELFSFYYNVLDDAVAGQYYFDVVISEAYNSSLQDVEISTSRKYVNVISKESVKTSYAYSDNSYLSTSYNETFTFTYYLDNSEPSSGAFVIHYDDTLFEFVSLTKLDFFDNMICDYNASLKGQIIVTFAEAFPDENNTLFEITLKTIKNVDTSTQISISASELYDTDMKPMKLVSNVLDIDVCYNSAYEEHPSLSTSAEVDTTNHQVVFTINLEENSHLGAGDFIFKFDKDVLTYVSSTKLISPTFFNVNDKAAQLEQGQIKFSILSTTDIVIGGDILNVTFSYEDARDNRNSSVVLTGNGLTDALTNPIELDISGTDFVISGVDLVNIWIDAYMYMDDPSFDGEGTGRCESEHLYQTAKTELLKLDDESITDFQTNEGNRYTDALARYLAWANANHDFRPFEDNNDFLNAKYNNFSLSQEENMMSVFIIIIAVNMVCFGFSILVYKKKRHQR